MLSNQKVIFCIYFLFFCFSLSCSSAEKRNLLQGEAEKINLAQSLIQNFAELNFPSYHDRGFWNSLPSAVRDKYIKNAEAVLDYNWPAIKATDYLEVVRSGDRKDDVFGTPKSILTTLVMGELAEGKGRFLDQIINGVWFYCEQTWWGNSAHFYLQKAAPGLPDSNDPTIDLGVGEVANTLSWCWFLFKNDFDKVHPLIAPRLKDEVMKKAIIPYYERNDFWWQGFDRSRPVNNWNPWINYNILTSILILEDNQEKKIEGVEKVIKSLDYFVNDYPEDGGCDEGPSYWGKAGASLFQCLDLLKKATGGRMDVFDNSLIKNIGNYIYKVYIDFPYFINFADADATTGSHPDIIFEYGKAIGDTTMQKFGAYLAEKQNWGENSFAGKIGEQISQLMHLNEIKAYKAGDVLISDFWLPNREVAGARDKAGSSDGFFFAAKGGNNAESHNHNDVGSCIVYYNGKPCLIDIGREKYTAKTFSSSRYDIWTMQSQFHNLPRINGVDQRNGKEYKATNTSFYSTKKQVDFSTDIALAYPSEAGVKKWVRNYQLERGKKFVINDSFELTDTTDTTSLNFIFYCKVQNIKPGIIQLTGYNNEYKLRMEYNPSMLTPKVEFHEVTDAGLKRYWPNGITRVIFVMNSNAKKGKSTIVLTPIPEK